MDRLRYQNTSVIANGLTSGRSRISFKTNAQNRASIDEDELLLSTLYDPKTTVYSYRALQRAERVGASLKKREGVKICYSLSFLLS